MVYGRYLSFILKPIVIGWLGFFLVLFSCKNEQEFIANNQAPVVRISVDHIGLPDSARLATQVKMSWSAQDADGYVTGYRVSWSANKSDAQNRLATAEIIHRTDSSFLFNFAGSSDTSSIYFFVSAIDDKKAVAKEPAFVRIPVRNSTPVIHFIDDGLVTADSIWSVISLPYTFSDPDGPENIDSIYLRINDGPLTGIPKNLSFFSIVPEDPTANGETSALLFAGENLSTLTNEPQPISGVRVPGLVLNGKNRFFIRIKDLAGATANDTTKEYFFVRKTSDLLLVDGYQKNNKDSLYNEIVQSVGNSFDRIDLNYPRQPGSKAGINQPKFWNASFYLLCKQYKKIFWYSDIYPSNQPAGSDTVRSLLSPAAASLNQFLRFEGKILLSCTFDNGANRLLADDAVYSLLPIDSFYRGGNNLTNIRLRPDGPVNHKQTGFPDLKVQSQVFTTAIISGVDIFHLKPSADTLYSLSKFTMGNSYPGTLPMPIALRSRNALNNRTNIVFFGMELFYLSGDKTALTTTFSKILNEEFNW